MKKLTIFLAAVLCIFLLGGCGGKADWNGTFSMKVDEYNFKEFDIEMSGEEGISYTLSSINTYGGGIAKGSVTGWADFKNGNTAENSLYKLSLSGDTLTVKVLTQDDYETPFEGKYTRGEPVSADEENSDEGNSDEEYSADENGDENGIVMGSYYYLDCDGGPVSLCFYDDNTVDYDAPDSQTEKGTWSFEADVLIITFKGQNMEFTVEDGGMTVVDSFSTERYVLGADYSRNEGSPDSYASESYEIVTNSFYYWDGDKEGSSLYFYADNTVDFDEPGEDTEEGVYYIDADTLIITWDSGSELKLYIEDGGAALVSVQDEYYYLAD